MHRPNAAIVRTEMEDRLANLIAAVRARELEEDLNQAAKTRTIGKVKKAA